MIGEFSDVIRPVDDPAGAVMGRPADPRRPFACTGGFQPAGFRAPDGRLWFPTSDGLAVIDPTLAMLAAITSRTSACPMGESAGQASGAIET